MRARCNLVWAGITLAVSLLSVDASAQQFVNGDFEQNTFAGCSYNETNVTFSAGMVGADGYGTGGVTSMLGEIDVMDGSCTQYGPVGPIGTTRIGLAANSVTQGFDALTLELTGPLVVGTSYTVSFWGHSVLSSFSSGAGQIRIGTSSQSGVVGNAVGVGALMDTSTYGLCSVTFTATAPDTYISVEPVMQTYRTWNWVDGFEIHPAQTAWCSAANGNGVNPSICTCLVPPVLGTAWVLDVAPGPNTLFTVMYVSLEHASPLSLPFGELLIDPPVASVPGNLTHVAPLPASTVLLGEPLWAQGLLVENLPSGLDLVLSNAQVGVIGY
ncbi:MAG: hypothetical protein ACE37K_25785 [Planctomycetota bacterium]